MTHQEQAPRVWDWRTWILKYGPQSATRRQILLTLSCYMSSSGGSCFPSVDTLIEATQLSKPTVIKHLKKAEEEGWIEVSQHGYGGKQWRRNEYRAQIPDKVVKQVNREGGEGGKLASEGGKADTGKVVKQVNSTSTYNSSSNSSGERARARGDTEEKVRDIWASVTGERPSLKKLVSLKEVVDELGLSEDLLEEAIRTAYLNVDRQAYRIGMGYLRDSYRSLLEDENEEVTVDTSWT